MLLLNKILSGVGKGPWRSGSDEPSALPSGRALFADESNYSPVYSTDNMVKYHIANNHLRNEETTLCG